MTTTAPAPFRRSRGLSPSPRRARSRAPPSAPAPRRSCRSQPVRSVSNATLTPGGPTVGVGAMSAGYGGLTDYRPLIYATTANFTFTTTAPEELYLNCSTTMSSGFGFDSLELRVNADNNVFDYTFSFLADAETFFSDHALDLGAINAGGQYIDLSFSLAASLSGNGSGFGFDYDLAFHAVPEPSTWAMMLLGFAGLGYAGYRRAGAGHATSRPCNARRPSLSPNSRAATTLKSSLREAKRRGNPGDRRQRRQPGLLPPGSSTRGSLAMTRRLGLIGNRSNAFRPRGLRCGFCVQNRANHFRLPKV